MTYTEYESSILSSDVSDWTFTGTGLVYTSDISIFIEYSLFDENVTIETQDLKNRISHYQQGSKYRLLYNGNCLHSQWFVTAGPGLAVCAIPVPEGYHGNEGIEVDSIHYYICYLISAHTCGVTREKFDEIMGIERITIE